MILLMILLLLPVFFILFELSVGVVDDAVVVADVGDGGAI